MKNKGLIILISSVVIVLFISIFFVFGLKSMDNNLLNKEWYHFDYKTGYFDTINFSENKINYKKPNDENITNEYSFCNNYKYNKINKKITLDCGKTINIKNVKSNKLVLNIDSKDMTFYSNINDSIKNEFKEYYNLNIDEYKEKNKQALDIIKIDENKIIDLLKDEDYSKIIFLGDNCNTVSCVLINDIIEKWISFSKNIYYVNSDNISDEILIELNNISNSFSLNKNDYNDIYPSVYVVNDNKVIDSYKIVCEGFKCSGYYNK